MPSDVAFVLITTLVQAAIAVLLALVVGGFHRFYSHDYMRDWAAAWWALAVYLGAAVYGVAAIGVVPADDPRRLLSSAVSLGGAYLHLFWMTAGVVALVRDRRLAADRRPAVVGGCLALAVIVTLAFAFEPGAAMTRYVLRYGLRALVTAAVFLALAGFAWRHRGGTPRRGTITLVASLGVHGIIALVIGLGAFGGPDFVQVARLELVLDSIDAVALVGIGLGMVTSLLDHERVARRRAVAGLEASESRHRRIVEGTGIALWEEDLSDLVARLKTVPARTTTACRAWLAAHPEFVRECIASIRVLGVNDATLRLYGARDAQELLDRLPSLFLPESMDAFIDELVTFWSGETSFDAEVASLTIQGDRRVLFYSIRAPFPEEGFRYVLLSVVDVTPLKAAEAALRESEERYRTLFDNAPVGIGVTDPHGTLLAVNDTMLALGGYTRDDVLPPVGELYYDGDARDGLLAELRAVGTVRQREVRFRHKDGTPWEANLSLARVTIDGQPCVLAIIEDIAQRKRLEEALRQAQKMEALGQLTGGLAHDFNNFLTAIQVNAELAADMVTEAPDEARNALEAVRRTADRSAALVRNLLAFSRREGLKLEPLILTPVLEESASLLRRLLPETIAVTAEVPRPLRGATVAGDRSAIEQMLVNLATNARDAMPDGGSLHLAVDEQRHEQAIPIVGGELPPGEWLTISVSDTGAGMPDGLAERAFEPFFTTKPQGAGSGLGLSMVYGLATQHRGGVTLETISGEGTTFTLYFPRADRPAAAETAPDAAAARGAGETILVVEDEIAIREATRRLLDRAGYRVLTAADGAEGLSVLAASAGAIRLVLADVVMPTMGGPQLLQAARARGFTAPFVFMSGYTERTAHPQLDAEVPLLAKPWRAGELLALVHHHLNAD